MKHCYVFFVLCGTENKTCKYLNDNLEKDFQISFVPKKEVVYKNAGRIMLLQKEMFPCYVFTKTDYPPDEFIKRTSCLVRHSANIIRLLGMDESASMTMSKEEKDFMMKLCDEQFIVRKSTGFIIGDQVIIKEGPLIGLESKIKRIDRHKRRAEIELRLLGEPRRINVSLEIVKKIKKAR